MRVSNEGAHFRRELRGLRGPLGEVLGSGFFNDVRTVPQGYVVKRARLFGPLSQPLAWLVRNRQEHELFAHYLRVPPTYHVRVRDRNGKAVNLILQSRLHGDTLSRLSDEELYRGRLRLEYLAVLEGMDRCYRELGLMPDVVGGPMRWDIWDVRKSSNLFVDTEGRIWFIDPSAVFLWFSSRNPLGWVFTGVVLFTARRLARKWSRVSPTGDRG